jgi:hypothetical protein
MCSWVAPTVRTFSECGHTARIVATTNRKRGCESTHAVERVLNGIGTLKPDLQAFLLLRRSTI